MHGHAGGDDARHGANGVMLVAGREGDLAAGGKGVRLFSSGGQPLVHQCAHDGAAHGAAHILVGDGRAGVEDGLGGHAGDDPDGLVDVHQHGVGVLDLLGGDAVGLVHLRVLQQAVQRVDEHRVAAGGGLPVHMQAGHMLPCDLFLEQRRAHIQDVQLTAEQILFAHFPYLPFTAASAMRTASRLLPATRTPASSSAARWAA